MARFEEGFPFLIAGGKRLCFYRQKFVATLKQIASAIFYACH